MIPLEVPIRGRSYVESLRPAGEGWIPQKEDKGRMSLVRKECMDAPHSRSTPGHHRPKDAAHPPPPRTPKGSVSDGRDAKSHRGRQTGRSGDARDDRDRPKRRGRPPGSISLTKAVEHTILTFIRGGAFDHVAAEAAGISVRTFHDWMARGEGRHPTRPRTARLRKFAENVSRAKAEARLDAEVRIHRMNPAYWLSRAARTKPNKEGWSEPHAPAATEGLAPRIDGVMASADTVEELARVIRELLVAGEITVPRCSNRKCPCPWHGTKEEQS